MASVPHAECGVTLLLDPRRRGSCVLLHGTTLEAHSFEGAWSLNFNAAGWAFLAPESSEKSPVWAKNVFDSKLVKAPDGRIAIVTKNCPSRWLPDLEQETEARYHRLVADLTGPIDARIKIYRLAVGRAGCRLMWQLREIQDQGGRGASVAL